MPEELNVRSASTEVRPRPVRRTFTADYKLKILAEVNSAKDSGEVGKVLRREGLYSSHLTTWRREVAVLETRRNEQLKRGKPIDEVGLELVRLRQENSNLRVRLERAELIVEIQKKVSQMLGLKLPRPSERS
jgi:transposase-like protein